jgi:hypothetical protein
VAQHIDPFDLQPSDSDAPPPYTRSVPPNSTKRIHGPKLRYVLRALLTSLASMFAGSLGVITYAVLAPEVAQRGNFSLPWLIQWPLIALIFFAGTGLTYKALWPRSSS